MADPQTQQVIVEFTSDTSKLQPGIEQLEQMGEVDAQSAAVFAKTNQQIKARNDLLKTTLGTTEQLSVEVTEQQAIFNKLTAAVKTLSGQSKEAVQTLIKLGQTGGLTALQKGFTDAAVSVDDYIAALQKASEATGTDTKATSSLRSELTALTSQLGTMIEAGQTTGAEFEQLAARAGKVSKSLQDARKVVGNLATDVPALKLLSTGIQGLTGAATAAQGAFALFGEDNKDLQETLVKVNSAMAISIGLTQALDAVKQQEFITTAKLVASTVANNVQTAINNGLESESIVIRTLATAAQWALNIAMAANPVGIVAAAIGLAVAGWVAYTNSAREAANEQARFNEILASTKEGLDDDIDATKRAGDEQLANLDNINAKESEKLRAQAKNTVDIIQKRNDAIDKLNAFLFAHEDEVRGGSASKQLVEDFKAAETQLGALRKQNQADQTELAKQNAAGLKAVDLERLNATKDLLQAQLDATEKNSTKQFGVQRQLAAAEAAIELRNAGDNEEKKAQIRAAAQEKQKQIDIAQAKFIQDDIEAAQERALIAAQNKRAQLTDQAGKAELDIENANLLERAKFAATNEKLTQDERRLIIDQANQKILENNRAFEKQRQLQELDNLKALNQVTLSAVDATEKEKLDARIRTIIETSQQEIIENRGKVDIIRGIEAKRDADIKAARLQSIEDELAQELALQEAQQAGAKREIQRQLAAQDTINNAQGLGGDKNAEAQTRSRKLSLDEQIGMINQLTSYELEAGAKKQDALDDELAQGLISQKTYDLKSQQLIDQQSQAVENGEAKKQAAINKTADIQKKRNREIVQLALQTVSDGLGLLQQLNAQNDQAAQDRIDRERKNIQDLQDAGDISAKAAEARNRKLDQEEKVRQREAAKRDKAMAIFTATINTALAVTNAIATGDPYTAALRAAIVIALGLAQIAIIAAKPLPQFKGGKRKGQAVGGGFGVWGEAGAELMEREGKMYVAKQATVSYIKPDDIIYNPKETADIMGGKVSRGMVPGKLRSSSPSMAIDYDRLGKTISENTAVQGMIFENEDFHEFIKKGNSYTKHLNAKRKWG